MDIYQDTISMLFKFIFVFYKLTEMSHRCETKDNQAI